MERPSTPVRRHPWDRITLAQMQRIKEWHAAQRGARPVEKGLWEAVLTGWLMGWIGWLPALVFEAQWGYGLCLLGIFAPRIYVAWRASAERKHLLRCDWLDLLN